MFPHLQGIRVNISVLQEAATKELLTILEKCDGTKVRAFIHNFLLLLLFCVN